MERWLLKKRNFWPEEITKSTNTSPIVSEILSRRELHSISDIHQYLSKNFLQVHSPYRLKGMREAVELICIHIKNNNKILFSLDYDVDGIISGAIAQLGFIKLGANCESIFPHRINDGYGLNERIVQHAIDNGHSCIITFDNGISAFEAIEKAKAHGIDVIVTDHHEVPIQTVNDQTVQHLVSADVIINPKQEACSYPFEGVCGAMLSFKLLQALNDSFGNAFDHIAELFPLVAIATICDVMPLVDENRIFVFHGLKAMAKTSNIGLQELMKQLNIHDEPSTYDIGFKIGPCFNSSGRLASAQLAFQLLISSSPSEAEPLAKELITLNEERKKLTALATHQALAKVEKSGNIDKILVVVLDNVHESLAGIVAGRLKEQYNKPALVFTKTENYYKGSARSIETVNIFEILSNLKQYFYKFGGHAAAAGLSIPEERFADFLSDLSKHSILLEIDPEKTYFVDAIVPINILNKAFAKELQVFEPTGKENPGILLASKDLILQKLEFKGTENKILRLDFFQNGETKSFVCFNIDFVMKKIKNKLNLQEEYDIMTSLPDNLDSARFDIIFRTGIRYYQANEYLNLELISIR